MNNIQNNVFHVERKEIEASASENVNNIPRPSSSFESVSGVSMSQIKALDLTKFRTNDLPKRHYWLLVLPVIGWVALACLKIHYVVNHSQAEKIMKKSHYDSAKTSEEKINILKKVIDKKGPLTWQYHLELAKLQLLNGDNEAADETLKQIIKKRGVPFQTGWYNVRDMGLVSFEVARGEDWVDKKNVIKITSYTSEEAMIHASVHASNGRFAEAYDSYNQAIYYDSFKRVKIRPLQIALVKAIQNKDDHLTPRELQIVKAETQYTKK